MWCSPPSTDRTAEVRCHGASFVTVGFGQAVTITANWVKRHSCWGKMVYRTFCCDSTDGQRSAASYRDRFIESRTLRVSITTMVELRVEEQHLSLRHGSTRRFVADWATIQSLVGLGKYLGLTRLQFSWCQQGMVPAMVVDCGQRPISEPCHCPAIVDACEAGSHCVMYRTKWYTDSLRGCIIPVPYPYRT